MEACKPGCEHWHSKSVKLSQSLVLRVVMKQLIYKTFISKEGLQELPVAQDSFKKNLARMKTYSTRREVIELGIDSRSCSEDS